MSELVLQILKNGNNNRACYICSVNFCNAWIGVEGQI